MKKTTASVQAMIDKARAAYEADLETLKDAGADEEFADYLSALPDPATDGKDHG